jgi:hypothetical protein
MLIIPALGILRQENRELEASLGICYVVKEKKRNPQ